MVKWIKRLGLVFLLPLLLVLIIVAWAGLKIVTHGQDDNQLHVAAKASYLKSIAAQKNPTDQSQTYQKARPNIIFILYDDLGYGDLGFTGAAAIETPAIDRLAANGIVLSNFYSPSPICTPSRAGFLTGRHAPRAGLPNVVFPTGGAKSLLNILNDENVRLPAEEIIIAELVRAAGYRTGMIGKWHLGDREPSLPNSFGFDRYFGALYSNDMAPFALYQDDKVAVEAPVDQTKLDALYTNEAVQFINQAANDGSPFFLYFAHNFPHRPLYVASGRSGRSDAGIYGDVVEALDAGVAKIVDALSKQDLLENTIIIISSDNGPWFEGSPGAFRGRKGQTWEGGMHVPLLIHWPDRLDGGQINDGMSMGTDLFPTIADWLDLPLPKDRIIDGKSIRSMVETGGETPHKALYFFANRKLNAIRTSKFKYVAKKPHVYVPNDGNLGLPVEQGPWLIDMTIDANESYDVTTRYPEQANSLRKALRLKRHEMETNLRGWIEK